MMAGVTFLPMKRLLFLACSGVVLSTLSGCAFMSDEDKDFYGRGWIKPTELDQQYPQSCGHADGHARQTSARWDERRPASRHDGRPGPRQPWDVPGARPQCRT